MSQEYQYIDAFNSQICGQHTYLFHTKPMASPWNRRTRNVNLLGEKSKYIIFQSVQFLTGRTNDSVTK